MSVSKYLQLREFIEKRLEEWNMRRDKGTENDKVEIEKMKEEEKYNDERYS